MRQRQSHSVEPPQDAAADIRRACRIVGRPWLAFLACCVDTLRPPWRICRRHHSCGGNPVATVLALIVLAMTMKGTADRLSLTQRVHEAISAVEHATVATVSLSGEPWNTPVFFVRNGRFFCWTSRTDAQHSINIRSNGRAFLVIYDSSRPDSSGCALYVQADVCELRDEAEIDSALRRIYNRRQESVPTVAHFCGASPHRVYEAVARQAWTNVLHGTDVPVWDERLEIDLPQ
jgi:hypothetical protein